MRFYPSPFIFSPGMPINTGGLRVNGKNAPFITLHRSSSFLSDGKSSNSIIQSAITAFFNYARYKRGAAYFFV